jgi:hypothetical protein
MNRPLRIRREHSMPRPPLQKSHQALPQLVHDKCSGAGAGAGESHSRRGLDRYDPERMVPAFIADRHKGTLLWTCDIESDALQRMWQIHWQLPHKFKFSFARKSALIL